MCPVHRGWGTRPGSCPRWGVTPILSDRGVSPSSPDGGGITRPFQGGVPPQRLGVGTPKIIRTGSGYPLSHHQDWMWVSPLGPGWGYPLAGMYGTWTGYAAGSVPLGSFPQEDLHVKNKTKASVYSAYLKIIITDGVPRVPIDVNEAGRLTIQEADLTKRLGNNMLNNLQSA